MENAIESINDIYSFFLAFEHADEAFSKIYVSKDPNPSLSDRFINALSCLDVYFGAGLFKKVEDAADDIETIIKKSSSPLPSIYLAGKIIIIHLI